jgi:hypothetical protein
VNAIIAEAYQKIIVQLAVAQILWSDDGWRVERAKPVAAVRVDEQLMLPERSEYR